VAGPGQISGYNLANNAAATSDEVLAFTPENQKAAFDAVGPPTCRTTARSSPSRW